jgi:rhamnogalacturonan endolyase
MFNLRKVKGANAAPPLAGLSKLFTKTLSTFIVASLCCSFAEAARQAEYLDRGVVALPSGNGVYVGWRMLGDDPSTISFNVYRNGTKITASPVTNSTNYFDASGTTGAAYTIKAVINGTELSANAAKASWTNPYLLINLQKPANGTTPAGEAYSYSPNDLSVGDLDGDGQYEIIVKWDPSNAKDNSQSGYTGNVFIDAYRTNGTQLWRIDLGKNIRAGAHYTQFMVYDLDGDGKAEVAMKTAPGTRDSNGLVLGGSNANADYRNSAGYILTGPEYLTVFNGETGAAMATTDYVPARGTVSSWGDNYGNRVDRFLAAVAYLDGSRPSLVMARGYYTRAVLAAWDWRDGRLSQRWVFDTNTSGSTVAGQGAHSLSVGDADGDGKDEIIYGAATIDDNGQMLYSTKLCHGDALHFGDFDPTRLGLEVFMVHESPSCYGNHGVEMHDAKTGAILWSILGGGDIGRGVTMDIDPRHAGNESWGSAGGVYSAKGALISNTKPNSINFRVLWDADLLSEQLNNTMINKWNYTDSTDTRLLTAYNYGAASNNGTKSTPGLSADIFGDWREEVIWRNENNSQLLIFTTTSVTDHKLPTLMHDIQYREAIAWQNVAYNQPPHPSFFLGAGMATPPKPDLRFVGKNPNDTITSSSSSRSSFSSLANSSANSSAVISAVNLNGLAGNGQIALNWTVSGNISSLEIYQDTDSNPSGRIRIAALDTSARGYTATGLSNGTTYWYWVKYTLDGVSYNSNVFSATPAGYSTSAQSSSPSSVPRSSVASSVRSSLATSSTPASSVASGVASSTASSLTTGGSSCAYVVTNQWGGGFTGAIRITNKSTSNINGWVVSWAYSSGSKVTSSWNVNITGSNPYSATGVSWNSTIAPGQTVEFGFQGTQTTSTAEVPKVTGSGCN